MWEQADGSIRVVDGGRELAHRPWVPPSKAQPVFKNRKPFEPAPSQRITVGRPRPQRPATPPARPPAG